MSGINAPTRTGNGVYFRPGTIGSGPDKISANGYLENRITGIKFPLWIYEFNSDFTATGIEVQSRLRKEFFARFFTQPRYLVKGQTSSQYEHQELAKFIRKGMLTQLKGVRGPGNDPLTFLLRIEGRGGYRARSSKGGHAGWSLEGYIEAIDTGGERFIYAPEYEFSFILANATEGPMKVLDTNYAPRRIANIREAYLAGFADAIEPPEKSPKKRPTSGDDEKEKDPSLLEVFGGSR